MLVSGRDVPEVSIEFLDTTRLIARVNRSSLGPVQTRLRFGG
jgi:hypothetical protein